MTIQVSRENEAWGKMRLGASGRVGEIVGFFNILLVAMPVAVQQGNIDPAVGVALFERDLVRFVE